MISSDSDRNTSLRSMIASILLNLAANCKTNKVTSNRVTAGLAPEQGSQGRCPKVFDGCCVFLLQMSSQSNFKVLVIQNAFLQLVQSCRLRCCLWFILSFLYSQCHQCFPLDCRMRSSQGNFKRQIHVSLCIQNSRSATWRKRSVNMSQCHHLQL